jgi:hypothetical protein
MNAHRKRTKGGKTKRRKHRDSMVYRSARGKRKRPVVSEVSKVKDSQEIPGFLKNEGDPKGFENMGPRDFAGVLLHRDYDAELIAIRILLFRHRKADKGLRDEIESLEKHSEFHNERTITRWLDLLQSSTYQDAAHSMAALGMLAPLLESMFYDAFRQAREEFFVKSPSVEHPRWERAARGQWDCHFFYDKTGKPTKDIVKGILQLSEAIGLTPYLPKDLKPMLEALFEYRNKMFHCGFVWPSGECGKFARRIIDAGWPSNWFETATIDGTPWIFYLTDAFVDHCLERVNQTIDGMGAFVVECLRVRRDDR